MDLSLPVAHQWPLYRHVAGVPVPPFTARLFSLSVFFFCSLSYSRPKIENVSELFIIYFDPLYFFGPPNTRPKKPFSLTLSLSMSSEHGPGHYLACRLESPIIHNTNIQIIRLSAVELEKLIITWTVKRDK